MNLCSDEHDEVCYESRHCPACHIRETLNDEISDLQKEVKKLETEISNLESQLE